MVERLVCISRAYCAARYVERVVSWEECVISKAERRVIDIELHVLSSYFEAGAETCGRYPPPSLPSDFAASALPAANAASRSMAAVPIRPCDTKN